MMAKDYVTFCHEFDFLHYIKDFNYSTNRTQAEKKSGELQYKKKVNRAGTTQSLAPLMVAKDYSWKHDIFKDVLNSCETGLVPDVTI